MTPMLQSFPPFVTKRPYAATVCVTRNKNADSFSGKKARRRGLNRFVVIENKRF